MTSVAANFTRFPIPEEALDKALLFPGSSLLRLATNAEGSGIGAAGDYIGIALLVQLDNDCPRCVLWDGGRTRGFDIAFHTDPVANGNSALLLSVSNDTVTYAARYEVNPRSPGGEKVYHSLEVEYVKDVGFKLWYDGVLLTATAVGGTHNDMSGGNTSHTALGGARNLSVTRARAALQLPAIVGTQSVWASSSLVADTLKGAIGYAMVERSIGIPTFEARLQSELFDEVDPGLAASPNESPNGFLWADTEVDPPAPAFVWTHEVIAGTSSAGVPLAGTAELVLSANADPYLTYVRLYNQSHTPIVLGDINVSAGGAGVSFVEYATEDDVVLTGTDVIAPSGFVLARLSITRPSEVTDRIGGVTFDLGTGGSVDADFSVTVAGASDGAVPLNANLSGKALPSLASTQLIKTLFIGDSQMGQSTSRLMGQVQKWDVPFAGRYLGMEQQMGSGILLDVRTGTIAGASVASTRVELGQDWGDGETGLHFHHGRKVTVTGAFSSNFQTLLIHELGAGAYAQAYNRDVRHVAKSAIYDITDQGIGGGFAGFRMQEYRGASAGTSEDYAIPGTGGIKVFSKEIRAAGILGSAGNDVGVIYRDSTLNDSDRSLRILGTLIYQSPSGTDFPATGFIPMQISQSSFSAYDHLNTTDVAAIDAAIIMAEGFSSIVIMLGHNVEDDGASDYPATYMANIVVLRQRIIDRHIALGYATPDIIFVAPWPAVGVSSLPRLREQTNLLYSYCVGTGDGFINLYDYFDATIPTGVIDVPRAAAQTYTLDPNTHPNDASTATNVALDIEWNFDPANWDEPPVEPVDETPFFVGPAFLPRRFIPLALSGQLTSPASRPTFGG